jgi:predicted nucleotidyltransferase
MALADVFDALAHQGLTQLQGPPAMFTRLLAWLDTQAIDHPAAPDLRYVYTGAAPLEADSTTNPTAITE